MAPNLGILSKCVLSAARKTAAEPWHIEMNEQKLSCQISIAGPGEHRCHVFPFALAGLPCLL